MLSKLIVSLVLISLLACISLRLKQIRMLTLYGSMDSRAHRNVWMLKELALKFTHIQTNFLNGSTRTSEFLAINPNGRVPVLVDNNFVLFESLAINLYLAKKYPGPLSPIDLSEDALATQWSFWAVTEIEKPLLFASANRTLFSPDQRDEEHALMAISKLERPLNVLEQLLHKQSFVLGNRFTVADLNIATVMDLAPQCNISLEKWPIVQKWLMQCLGRPAASDWKSVSFSIPKPPTTLGLLKMFV
jgi:glutathione S-transferase